MLIPDPLGVRLRYVSVRSRTVSLRLPGSLTTPRGGTGPLRVRYKVTFRAHMRVRVRVRVRARVRVRVRVRTILAIFTAL